MSKKSAPRPRTDQRPIARPGDELSRIAANQLRREREAAEARVNVSDHPEVRAAREALDRLIGVKP